jgi:hypothetical protein
VAKRQETLLGQCLLRSAAEIALADGLDLSARKGQKLKALKLAGRAIPKASRVAEFVVTWAVAMDELADDELTLSDWRRWANESDRTAWRHLAEFRELFPEFETPTPIARELLRHMRRLKTNVAAAINLPVSVPAPPLPA